ncbi:MAG: sugar transferase [Geminocystis sp.]|nr:sugar transferase [Geminocystis sp.]MCS7147148.1 sugar transferase [Geminocystis sp.]
MQDNFYTRFYIKFGKRWFDFVASLMALIVLSPVFIIISILIKLMDEGPIFYQQKRMGQDFKPFLLIKFRTMTVDADKIGPLVTSGDDKRITKIGKFLRKTKLDELPQLFNVIKGDMSIVGPRPEVEKYVKAYEGDYKDILKVKPGITDYATVVYSREEEILKNFENPEEGYIREILPKKIELYKKYIAEMGFKTDLKIIIDTIIKIIKP